MEEELLHSRRLPNSLTWVASDTPVHEMCANDEECGHFNNLDIGVLPHVSAS